MRRITVIRTTQRWTRKANWWMTIPRQRQACDGQVLKDLIKDEDKAVFADSTYASESSDELLISRNCQNFILFKASRGHPLSEEEQATNKLRSQIRVRCEHVFGRMSQMAMDRLRTIGLSRANQHNGFSNLVYNMDRYAFLLKER